MQYSLKKSEILRGRNNFQRIFKHGEKVDGKFLRCLVLPAERLNKHHIKHVIVGFAVARTVKRAVDRNRVRRLIRESYRRNKKILLSTAGRLDISLELVFTHSQYSSSNMRNPTYLEIEHEMKKLFDNVIQAQRTQ
jgi:ribonuclease P protein component